MALTADRKARLTSLAGVALLHLVVGWGLLLSLAPTLVRSVSEPLGVFNVREVPPPPPERQVEPAVERVREAAPAPAEPTGMSAAPAPRAAASVVASERVVDRDIAPPVAAGLVPAGAGSSGTFSSDSQAEGAGSGGDGAGKGTSGNGLGGGGTGGSGGAVTRPELRSGRIVPRDYPGGARGHQGIVETRLTVSASGVVTACTVTRSSGNGVLDEATCRLQRERFRFTPARDVQGNPVPGDRGWRQRWWKD